MAVRGSVARGWGCIDPARRRMPPPRRVSSATWRCTTSRESPLAFHHCGSPAGAVVLLPVPLSGGLFFEVCCLLNVYLHPPLLLMSNFRRPFPRLGLFLVLSLSWLATFKMLSIFERPLPCNPGNGLPVLLTVCFLRRV